MPGVLVGEVLGKHPRLAIAARVVTAMLVGFGATGAVLLMAGSLEMGGVWARLDLSGARASW